MHVLKCLKVLIAVRSYILICYWGKWKRKKYIFVVVFVHHYKSLSCLMFLQISS